MKLASGKGRKAWVQSLLKTAHLETEVLAQMREMASEWDPDTTLGWLATLLVGLRAAAMIHQSHHWQTRGQTFYGDHLLFERLYNDTLPGVDALAERVVGIGGPTLVDPVRQAVQMARCISQCYSGRKEDEGSNGMVEISLQKEYRVLEGIRLTIKVLASKDSLTDGTENLLQDIADKHEEFVYLLKQRSNVTPYSYAR